MRAPKILYCTNCRVWFSALPTADSVCIDCGQSTHLTTPEAMERQPLKLSENDKKFLKSIRISVNNDHEDDCA